jgi:hypothetical protein
LWNPYNLILKYLDLIHICERFCSLTAAPHRNFCRFFPCFRARGVSARVDDTRVVRAIAMSIVGAARARKKFRAARDFFSRRAPRHRAQRDNRAPRHGAQRDTARLIDALRAVGARRATTLCARVVGRPRDRTRGAD